MKVKARVRVRVMARVIIRVAKSMRFRVVKMH